MRIFHIVGARGRGMGVQTNSEIARGKKIVAHSDGSNASGISQAWVTALAPYAFEC